MKRTVITGKVTRRPYAVGSKSEQVAVMLVSGDREFRLRRMGGDPYLDPSLDRLVGKEIKAEGVVTGPSFILEREISER